MTLTKLIDLQGSMKVEQSASVIQMLFSRIQFANQNLKEKGYTILSSDLNRIETLFPLSRYK